jgi:hypothetical protein
LSYFGCPGCAHYNHFQISYNRVATEIANAAS